MLQNATGECRSYRMPSVLPVRRLSGLSPSALETDLNEHDSPPSVRLFDTRVPAECRGTLGNRTWDERGWRLVSSIVRNAHGEMAIVACEANHGPCAARVSPHIAESFGYYLQHLGGEPIIESQVPRRLDRHGNPGRLGKPLAKLSQHWQQTILQDTAVAQCVYTVAQVCERSVGQVH